MNTITIEGIEYKVNPIIEGELLLRPVKEEPKLPTRWRAERFLKYWFIDVSAARPICWDYDNRDLEDELRYKRGNYFSTEEQAKLMKDAINQAFEYVHTGYPDKIEEAWIGGAILPSLDKVREALREESNA